MVRKYESLAHALEHGIRSGKYGPNTPLPPIRALMGEFGYSLATVTRAIDSLEQRALVARVPGKGVFVAGAAFAAGRPNGQPASHLPAGVPAADLCVGVISSFPEGQRSADMWWAPITHGVEDAAMAQGGAVRMLHTGNAAPRRVIRDARAQGINAVVNLGDHWKGSHLTTAAEVLRSEGLPAVMAWSSQPRPLPLSLVDIDNRHGVSEAFRHLFELGHRDIAFLGYDNALSWAQERERAYRECADQAGTATHVWHTAIGRPMRQLPPTAEEILRDSTAVIAANDDAAAAFIDAAAASHRSPPQDFSIVGFDDDVLYRPRELTTVRQNMEAIGRAAVTLIGELSRGTFGDAVMEIQMKPELMIRHTTGMAD